MRNHKQNWLDVFHTFRVAMDAKKIILGMLGVYFSAVVILGLIVIASYWWPHRIPQMDRILMDPCSTLQGIARLARAKATCSLTCSSAGDVSPLGGGQIAFLAGSGILLLAIWSVFGGALARLAAVDFAKDERFSISDGFSFAANKFGAFFWSSVAPLLLIVVLLCCNALLGLVGRIPFAGPIVVGLFFWLPTLVSFVVALLLLLSVFGAIFMWPTIAMEGTDSFDAVSRGFNYLFARPWKTLWCWLAASAYGVTCLAFVVGFTWLLLKIALLSVASGMGASDGQLLRSLWVWGSGAKAGVPEAIAVILVRVIVITVWALVLGFWASFKISAMTIIYAIIRRDVDGTDMSEVYLPESADFPEAPDTPEATPEELQEKQSE